MKERQSCSILDLVVNCRPWIVPNGSTCPEKSERSGIWHQKFVCTNHTGRPVISTVGRWLHTKSSVRRNPLRGSRPTSTRHLFVNKASVPTTQLQDSTTTHRPNNTNNRCHITSYCCYNMHGNRTPNDGWHLQRSQTNWSF